MYCVVQVTFAIPYIPDGYRRYDFRAFADILDFMFIMAYDATGRYSVGPNCPLNEMAKGGFFGGQHFFKGGLL